MTPEEKDMILVRDQEIADLKAEVIFLKEPILDTLQKYNEFLLKHGYTDTDIISEEPTAIDQFVAEQSIISLKS